MLPIPYPFLVADHHAYIVRAHRQRSALLASLIAKITSWVSAAAR
jgi:hypothetical protein